MTTVARHPSAQTVSETRQGERGFTLIELSIVLVIIGLLIGGILQGQEMINNTRLKTMVAQVDGVTAAVQTFEDKYRAMPGDYSQANARILAALTNGDGNGVIGTRNNANAVALAGGEGNEMTEVWEHLSAANLLTGTTNDNPANYEAKVTDGEFDIATFAMTNGGNAVGVRLRNISGAANAVLTTPDAATLDERYDDAMPNTGRWQAAGGANCVADNAAATNYNFLQAGTNCLLVMRIR